MSALAPFQSLPSRLVGTSRRRLAWSSQPAAAAPDRPHGLGGGGARRCGASGRDRPPPLARALRSGSRFRDRVPLDRHPPPDCPLRSLRDRTSPNFPSTYLARNHEPDGAREDVLTFGRLGDAGPFLQLSLLRAGIGDEAGQSGIEHDRISAGRKTEIPSRVAAPASPPDALSNRDVALADALARLAGSQGMTATRIRPAAPVTTRLGPVEAADLLLWAGETAVPCLGFQGSGDAAAVLHIGGFACGAPGRPVGRAALACALDRIDLLSAGDDAALRALFVAAQRLGRGSSCIGGATASLAGARPPRLARSGCRSPASPRLVRGCDASTLRTG